MKSETSGLPSVLDAYQPADGVDLSDANNWIRVHPKLHAKYVTDSQRLRDLLEDIPYESELELVQVIRERDAEIEELKAAIRKAWSQGDLHYLPEALTMGDPDA